MFKKIIQLATSYIILAIDKVSYAVSTSDLLPNPSTENSTISGGYGQIENVNALPEVTLESGVSTIIQTLLGWTFAVSLISIVVAAIYFLAFEGEEGKITKGKDTIIYLLIGMLVIAAAYGIISGILKFDFFA